MKKLLTLLSVFLACTIGWAQNPSFKSFNQAEFTTNGFVIGLRTNRAELTNHVFVIGGNNIQIATNANFTDGTITYTVSAVGGGFVSSKGIEVWNEPFNGGDVAAGTIGSLGWQQQSGGVGGGSINFSNAVNHAGTANVGTSTSANSIQSLFNSDTPNGKPTIFPLNARTGWTNRFIWRVNNTNTAKFYIALIGNANFTQAALENSIGIAVITTNSNQIMGHTSVGSSVSTTNLGGIVNNQWNTNEIWSDTSGVISFSLNDGPRATLSTTLPTTGLTPAASAIKNVTDVAANLELDEWVFIWRRD